MDDLDKIKIIEDFDINLDLEDIEEISAALANDVFGFDSTCSICGRIVGGKNDETRHCTEQDCPYKKKVSEKNDDE